MNTKIWLGTLLLSLLSFVMIFDIFSSSDAHMKKNTSHDLDLKEKQFTEWFTTYDENASRNQFWGLPSKRVVIKKTDTTVAKKLTPVTQKKGENKICIETSCYRLLAIKNIDKAFEALFYNRAFKEKVQLFKTKSPLEKGIYVKDVTLDHVYLEDNNSDRKWTFKMFDVNTTQYKPKGRDD